MKHLNFNGSGVFKQHSNLSSVNTNLYMTPIRSSSATSLSASGVSSANHQLASWTSRLTGGVIGSGLPQRNSPAVFVSNVRAGGDDSKDRCEHQASMYRRQLCDHCGEKFCDSCEIKHKEHMKKDIIQMAVAFLNQPSNLDRELIEKRAMNVRDQLTVYAEKVRRNVESEIMNTTLQFQSASKAFMEKLRSDGDTIIAGAFEMRDAEVNDLIAIALEAVRCQEDNEHIEQMVDWLRAEQVCYITLHEMASKNRQILRYYGMRCALDALCDTSNFYADKTLEFNRHPGYMPMLDRCLDFFHTVQLGSVKFSSPVKKIRAMLSGKQNLDMSPFKPLFASSSTDGLSHDFIGKSFYDRIRVVSVVQGKDADSWEIRKPFGLVWLPNTDYLAVVHRPKRITLITVSGEIRATYKFADPDSNQTGGLNFHGNLAADDEWKIYFIDEPGLRIFSFDVKSNPLRSRSGDLVTPRVFTRLQSLGGGRSAISLSQFSDSSNEAAFCNKMKFHGLAIGLARRELYTEAGDSIVAFSLVDGIARFRCLLEPSHQFSSHVLGVMDRPNSISYLIYSTSHGNVLHKKAFQSDGLLEVGSSVIAFQGCEINCVSEVRGVATDPAGNLLLADSKNGCIKVFSDTFQVFSSFGLGDRSMFNPSAVAVAYLGNGQPVVCVTEFSSHRIIFFSGN